MRPVLNQRFDLTGGEYTRLLRLSIFGKLVPIGNWRGGPGLRCLITLAVLHYLGETLYRLKDRYGHRLGPIRRLAARMLKRH